MENLKIIEIEGQKYCLQPLQKLIEYKTDGNTTYKIEVLPKTGDLPSNTDKTEDLPKTEDEYDDNSEEL